MSRRNDDNDDHISGRKRRGKGREVKQGRESRTLLCKIKSSSTIPVYMEVLLSVARGTQRVNNLTELNKTDSTNSAMRMNSLVQKIASSTLRMNPVED